MKTKVLAILKPKVLELGFTTEELDGVAATIADKLKEDANDEEINASIDAVIPYLKVSQTAVNRIINAKKQEKEPKSAPKGSDTEPTPSGTANTPESKLDKILQIVMTQQTDIEQLKSKNLGEQRRAIFEKKIDGLLPKQKEDMLDDFDLIAPTFKTDEEFNAYLTKKGERVLEIKQELANEGLAKMTPPKGGGQTKTDEEEFAEMMAEINKKEEQK